MAANPIASSISMFGGFDKVCGLLTEIPMRSAFKETPAKDLLEMCRLIDKIRKKLSRVELIAQNYVMVREIARATSPKFAAVDDSSGSEDSDS